MAVRQNRLIGLQVYKVEGCSSYPSHGVLEVLNRAVEVSDSLKSFKTFQLHMAPVSVSSTGNLRSVGCCTIKENPYLGPTILAVYAIC